jgi:hypothetical protein
MIVKDLTIQKLDPRENSTAETTDHIVNTVTTLNTVCRLHYLL